MNLQEPCCEKVGRTTQAYWSSLYVPLNVILSDLHGKARLTVCVFMRLRGRAKMIAFSITGFVVLNTEKPCGWERAFLWALGGPSPYWLVYERSPESALWWFPLTRLILPWLMPAIKAISNIYYYTVGTSPWPSPHCICDSVLLQQI